MATAAATEPMRMSRLRTCMSSCASTPRISSHVQAASRPWVTATAAWCGVAAGGEGVGLLLRRDVELGHRHAAFAASSRTMAKYWGCCASSAGTARAARMASESLFQYEKPTRSSPRARPMMAPPRPNSDPMATIRPPSPARRIVVFTVFRSMGPGYGPRRPSRRRARDCQVTVMVALLRGINVGGRGKLPMADLRAIADGPGLRRRRHLHPERQPRAVQPRAARPRWRGTWRRPSPRRSTSRPRSWSARGASWPRSCGTTRSSPAGRTPATSTSLFTDGPAKAAVAGARPPVVRPRGGHRRRPRAATCSCPTAWGAASWPSTSAARRASSARCATGGRSPPLLAMADEAAG